MTNKQLLEAVLYAFNELPNKHIGHEDFKDTYALASAISAKLRGDKVKKMEYPIHVQQHQDVFFVYSSNGELTVSLESGNVINCEMYEGGEGIDKIERFDIKEQQEYRKTPLKEGGSYDILDFGTWMKDGSYEEPEHSWRKQCEEDSIFY